MKVYHSLEEFSGAKNVVLTTGTFDGVHLGHKKIIKRLCESAASSKGETVIFSFFPHPRMVLFPEDHGLRLLNTREEKIALFEEAGVDHLIIEPFSPEFGRLKPLEYVRDILVNALHVKRVVVGYDHRFGRNREGDIKILKECAETYDFSVDEIPAEEISNIRISSTKIRAALDKGEVKKAARFLGYNYQLTGKVVHGDGLGKGLGFPTANLKPDFKWKLIPAAGVYAVKCKMRTKTINGMANIGYRPTMMNDTKELRIEAHLFEWNSEIYGENITLAFIDRIRPERKFNSPAELTAQLKLDKTTSLKILQ